MGFNIRTYWLNGPGSRFKQDLRKGRADIIAMQSFLSAQVIGRDDGSTTSALAWPEATPEGLDGFLKWISDDAHATDPKVVNETLHTNPKILQTDETAELAFKTGRDLVVFTSKRILVMDVKGWSGKKVEYWSAPLKYLWGFEVKSAGSIGFMNSAHATVFTDVPSKEALQQDLSSSTNIWPIQTYLAEKLLDDGGWRNV